MVQTEPELKSERMKSLLSNTGWKILVEYINKQIEYNTKLLQWEGMDLEELADANKVEFTQHDIIRKNIGYLKWLRDLPGKYTKDTVVIDDNEESQE